jgi:hypothetical protein
MVPYHTFGNNISMLYQSLQKPFTILAILFILTYMDGFITNLLLSLHLSSISNILLFISLRKERFRIKFKGAS